MVVQKCVEAVGAMASAGSAGAATAGTTALANAVTVLRVPPPDPSYW